MWRTLHADGCDWEVRSVSHHDHVAGSTDPTEILEFRPLDGQRPARRIAVPAGELDQADETRLRMHFQKARPIGGDHYGRPGKRMGDAA